MPFPSGFHEVNPIFTHGYERLAATWQTNKLKQFALRHPWRSVYFVTKFLRKRIEAGVRIDPNVESGDPTLEEMFALPEDWTPEQRTEYNLDLYKKYLRLMAAMAKQLEIKQAFFIQPCPAINKTLTKDEERVVGDLSYRDAYQEMTTEALALREEGVNVTSLLDVFSKVKTSVYADRVHCVFQKRGAESKAERGNRPSEAYQLVAAAMAEGMANAWDIPLRKR